MEYPFKFFVEAVHPKIIAENPKFTFDEVTGELDAQWAKVSDVEKRKYIYLTDAEKREVHRIRWVPVGGRAEDVGAPLYAVGGTSIVRIKLTMKYEEMWCLRGGGWT